jgi:hypothetical protein
MKLCLTVFGLTFSIQHACVRRITPRRRLICRAVSAGRLDQRVESAPILSGALTMFSPHEEDGFT